MASNGTRRLFCLRLGDMLLCLVASYVLAFVVLAVNKLVRLTSLFTAIIATVGT